MKITYKIITPFILLLFLTGCEKNELFDFELNEETVEFKNRTNTLKGTLVKPGTKKYPLVIFVHGDGSADRYQNGYYKYIWKELNKNGIGCLAWDKPGIGQSTGKWLNQSMDDRAQEVISALTYVKQRNDIDTSRIILWGLSQGCWVIPKSFQLTDDVSAVVFQSPAINWLRQGRYHLKCKLKKKKYTDEVIKRCLAYYDLSIKYLDQNSYKEYKEHYYKQPEVVRREISLMTEERWSFVVKNYKADVSNDLSEVTCPVLALFGKEDENVDTQESLTTFNNIFKQNGNDNYKGVLINDADHALLDIRKEGKKGTKEDVWYKLLYKGKDVYAAGYLEISTDFLLNF
jgi:pimeloyl-ACP methyl ester carboxylesterase